MSTDKSENYEFLDLPDEKLKPYDLKGKQFHNQREGRAKRIW